MNTIVKYIPRQGDRVQEQCRGGIIGHVQDTRHVFAGIEAKVFLDGSIESYWILADTLTCIRPSDPMPTSCEFSGWTDVELAEMRQRRR